MAIMKFFRRLLKWIFILMMMALAAYGAYTLYEYVIEDATARIKKGAEEGVSKGVGKGVKGILNPFKWF